MREIMIPAGERVCVVRRLFSSYPTTIRIEARRAEGVEEPSGTLEVHGSTWIFPKTPVTSPLQATHTVHKGYWDTFFSVYVCPETDVIIRLDKTFPASFLWLTLVVFLVALTIIVLILILTSTG